MKRWIESYGMLHICACTCFTNQRNAAQSSRAFCVHTAHEDAGVFIWLMDSNFNSDFVQSNESIWVIHFVASPRRSNKIEKFLVNYIALVIVVWPMAICGKIEKSIAQ